MSLKRVLRRSTFAAAVVAVVATVLSGCLYAAIPEEGATPVVPGGDRPADLSGVPAELMEFYEQPLAWEECDGRFECTVVTAPLDWSSPGEGTIELAVIRARATSGAAQGSLLVNPGGPGASGLGFVRDSLSFAVGRPLIESYDVIGFDPRGVGESTAVSCYDAAEMDAYLYDLPKAKRGTPEWEAELTARNKAFAEACERNSGGILPYITTEQSARDMDLLRAVLGDKKLNYLGYSYGTFLGATYAKLFPERVGRLVLDGAIDPAVPGSEVGFEQALGFEQSLRAYMQNCLSTKDCPFSGTVDEGLADLKTLLESVDRTPLEGQDGRKMGADSLVTAIVAALYSQASWPYLTEALRGALAGDTAIAFFLADNYNGREGGVYIDNSAEAFRAYNCVDYPQDATPESEARMSQRLAEEAPTIATFWEGPDSCEVWTTPATGVRERIAAAGADPIVVVGTTGDPATPYKWSVALADQLESGVLVSYEGEGHTGYNKGNSCVNDAVEAYLLEGTVPQDGLRCG